MSHHYKKKKKGYVTLVIFSRAFLGLKNVGPKIFEVTAVDCYMAVSLGEAAMLITVVVIYPREPNCSKCHKITFRSVAHLEVATMMTPIDVHILPEN